MKKPAIKRDRQADRALFDALVPRLAALVPEGDAFEDVTFEPIFFGNGPDEGAIGLAVDGVPSAMSEASLHALGNAYIAAANTIAQTRQTKAR